ncbi:MAG: hypothetical protein VXY16_10435 [Pseudomonadota bacterium]|nr:hypothetical protein [Pseudomonadota bacterium]
MTKYIFIYALIIAFGAVAAFASHVQAIETVQTRAANGQIDPAYIQQAAATETMQMILQKLGVKSSCPNADCSIQDI